MKSRMKDMSGRTWTWMGMALRALSGDSVQKDGHNKQMGSRVNRGHFPQPTSAFSIPVEIPEGSPRTPYNAIWIKTPDGAFTVADIFIRNPQTGEDEEAHALLFCRDPSIMGNCLLRNRDQKFYKKPEVENAIIPVDARLKKDTLIVQQRFGEDGADINFEHRKPRYDFNWVETSIKDFGVKYGRERRRHGLGILSRDKSTLRSASSAFWMEEFIPKKASTEAFFYPYGTFDVITPDEPVVPSSDVTNGNGNGHAKKFHLWYHCNPIHTNDSFLGRGALDNKRIRTVLKKFSIRLTEHPVDKKTAEELMRARFHEYASAIMRRRDPYKLPFTYDYREMEIHTDKRIEKKERFAKATALRELQKIGLNVSGWERNTVLGGLAATAFVTLALQIPALFLAAGALKTPWQYFSNIVTSGWRKFNQLLTPVELAKTRSDGNMAEHLTFRKNVDLKKSDTSMMPLHTDFIPFMELVDVNHFYDTFPNIKPYTPESELEWVKPFLYSTTSRAIGTIVSERTDYGYLWTEFREPSGITVMKNDSIRTAIARIESEPMPGSVREKPVMHLFEQELKPAFRGGMQVKLAITMGDDGKLSTFGMTEFQNIPDDFLRSQQTIDDHTPALNKAGFAEMMDKRPPPKLVQAFQLAKTSTQAAALSTYLHSAPMTQTGYQTAEKKRISPDCDPQIPPPSYTPYPQAYKVSLSIRLS